MKGVLLSAKCSVDRNDMRKNIILILISILSLSIVGCGSIVEKNITKDSEKVNKIVEEKEDEKKGNLNGNLVNGGAIAYQGEWLYFSLEGSLYKSKLDGSEVKKIYTVEENDGDIANINIVNDKLYFSAGNIDRGGLYRIKKDGSSVKKLISDTEGGIRKKVYVVGKQIYYDQEYMLKRDGDGSDKKKIIEERQNSTNSFSISDGYIYYCGKNLNDDYCIYKMTLDGSQKEEICEGNIYNINVEDGWIYYIDNQNRNRFHNLCRMKTDGTETQEILDKNIISYNIKDEWIYYILSENGEDIFGKIKIDGTENQKFNLDISEIHAYYGLYIIEDWIYYMDDNVIKRIKQDGSEQQIVYDFKEKAEEVNNDKKESNEEQLELNNTYQTKFGDTNMVTFPKFAFDFPSVWNIEEEVTTDGEIVTISNERGVKITYSHISGVPVGKDAIGGSSVFMTRVEASKVAESSFVPSYVQATDYSNLGKFVVAQLKVTGELDMKVDSDFKEVDGSIAYAVIPESLLGIDEDVRNPYCIEYGFKYGDGISFIAEAPENGFTKQEENVVIEILKSFRAAE